MVTQATAMPQEHQLLKEMKQVQTDLQQLDGRREQHLDVGGDMADRASRAMDVATVLVLRRTYKKKLAQLQEAHTRLREGQHGICESCGEQIDPARLDVVPHAILCIGCQCRSERRRG